MSNAERQRRFRERNPGYYGRLHRKRNAMMAPVAGRAEAVVPLMLPAPAEPLPLFITTDRERVPVPLESLMAETEAGLAR
jgi:hypothetical protein